MTQNPVLELDNYVFKKYAPDQGFEDFQALIYNAAIKVYDGSTVTGEAIKTRLQNHKPEQDRNGITFAFLDDQPVAYIQYREYNTGKVYIGFPWSVPGTPDVVSDKLFNDLFFYIKDKYPDKKQLFLGFINTKYTGALERIKSFGFSQNDWTAIYEIPFNLFPSFDPSYQFKLATVDDLDSLLDVSLSDDSVNGMGREGLENFFKNNLFNPEQNTLVIILQKDGVNIGVIGSNINDDLLPGRIVAVKKGHESSFKHLLGAFGAVLKEKNISKAFTMPVDDTVKYQVEYLDSIGAKVQVKTKEFVTDLN